jgi:hypothetical protein
VRNLLWRQGSLGSIAAVEDAREEADDAGHDVPNNRDYDRKNN